MKRKILLLGFLLISLVSICQNKIKTSGIFETGFENRRVAIYLEPVFQQNTGWYPMYEMKPFFGYLYLDAELKGFRAYTSNKTYFNKDTQIYFNPQSSEFKIGMSYTRKSLTAGYEHMCTHTFEERKYSDFYDRIYVRVKLFGNPPTNINQ